MKKTKLSIILSGLIIVTAVIVASCTKSTTTTTTPTVTPDTNTTSATDNQTAQQSSNDITNFGSQGIDNGSLSTYRLTNPNAIEGVSGSANVSIDTINKKVTILFTAFVGFDGITRNGTLIYSWTGNFHYFKTPGFNVSVATTSASPYTISSASWGSATYTVEITKKTIRNLGTVSGNYTWSDSSNITIVKPGSGTNIQWQGYWMSTLLNTNNTTYNGTPYAGVYPTSSTGFINWNNAILSISGTFSGTASDGETYTGNISTPLVLNLNCTPPGTKYLYVAGQINFTPTGKTTRSINYGTGTCDLTYTVSIGSFSVTITI